jgi:hypothetical protein
MGGSEPVSPERNNTTVGDRARGMAGHDMNHLDQIQANLGLELKET